MVGVGVVENPGSFASETVENLVFGVEELPGVDSDSREASSKEAVDGAALPELRASAVDW